MARNQIPATNEEMLQGVKEYAKAHYEKGWDIVVEGMTDNEILWMARHANSVRGAIYKVAAHVKSYNAVASDIKGA